MNLIIVRHFIMIYCMGAASMACTQKKTKEIKSSAQPPSVEFAWGDEQPTPIVARTGSKYWIREGHFKIKPCGVLSDGILPVSVGITNLMTQRMIRIKVVQVLDNQYVPPVPGGFEVLSPNPSDPVTLQAGEFKVISVRIKINSGAYQHLRAELLDEDGKAIPGCGAASIYINKPLDSEYDYDPFEESMLRYRKPPLGTQYNGSADVGSRPKSAPQSLEQKYKIKKKP